MRRRAIVAWVAAGLVAGLGGCGGGTPGANDGAAGEAGGGCGEGCGTARECCSGSCVNLDNDPRNCGGCGTACSGTTPFCDGTCKPLPCDVDGGGCGGGGACCGSQCCTTGQLCCKDEGPVTGAPTCFTPTAQAPTCPPGCAPLCVSDHDLKRDVAPVETAAVLETLVRVPISTWAYRDDRAGVRHLGPMAQDFYAAFGLGSSDRAYDPVDAHGVAFAAIQGLRELVARQEARLEQLEREQAALRRRCTGGGPARGH